jgi:hypothetical protein
MNYQRLRKSTTILKQRQLNMQLKSVLDKRQIEVDKLHKSQLQLEVISGLSAEEAKDQLVEGLKAEAKTKRCLTFKIRLKKLS